MLTLQSQRATIATINIKYNLSLSSPHTLSFLSMVICFDMKYEEQKLSWSARLETHSLPHKSNTCTINADEYLTSFLQARHRHWYTDHSMWQKHSKSIRNCSILRLLFAVLVLRLTHFGKQGPQEGKCPSFTMTKGLSILQTRYLSNGLTVSETFFPLVKFG